jgi:hypothetical protein
MTLRVTRQFGEVLGTGVGSLRVARQYAEILGSVSPVIYASASNELTMTQGIHVPFIYASVSSTLALATESGEALGTGETALLDSVLNITHTLVTRGLLQGVSTSISLTQPVSVRGPIYQFMVSPMRLISEPSGAAAERNLALETLLVMIDVTGRGYNVDVTSSMSVVQDMHRRSTPTSTMTLSQTVDYGKTRGLEVSELGLDHVAILNGEWSRPVAQSLGVGHSLTYYVPSACGAKSYTPFIGENTSVDAPTPPDASVPFAPGLPDGERFQLLYPGIGQATDTVELRAPNLDNRERLSFTRINRETRGGRLIVFADPTWPTLNTLVLSFSGLSKAEVDSLQAFMVAHLGEEVGLIDWEGRQWVGVITSPDERAVQDGGGCDGNWTIGLEFEGVLLEEAPSGSHLTITTEVVAVLN